MSPKLLARMCGLLLVVPALSRAQEALHPELCARVDEAVQEDAKPRSLAEALWLATCERYGSEVRLLDHLEALQEAAKTTQRQDQVRRLRARIARRSGRLEIARAALEGIGEARRKLHDELAIAEVLDALGEDARALEIYERIAAREVDPASKKLVLLRRALMGKGLSGLASFASSPKHSSKLRNEAAILLALRGDQKAAIRSFVARGEGTPRFRAEIRRAEWAMEAGDFDKAQAAAWLAVEHARLTRDRRYALSVLASAYRRDDAVGELLARFASEEQLSTDARRLWIRLLREEGRADDALRLFRESSNFDSAMRRQLLEICRETGREETLIEAYRKLIREEAASLEWRSGLSRHYLEKGDREAAVAVWSDIASQARDGKTLLEAAQTLESIGLDEVAIQLAQQAAQDASHRARATMFIFQIHLGKGEQEKALATLRALDHAGAAQRVRAAVADGYERLGRVDLAVQTLESLRKSNGGTLGTDLEMKFATLLSRIGREGDALPVWRALWSKLRATPRARFVEDRMMTVASRTGHLAKIAIELEDRLGRGDGGLEDVELLVRLYVKVGDPASATEIVEEFLERTGTAQVEILRRKAKIYRACQDYYHYEQVIQELVKQDEEKRLDHLRELAMSQLERGRRDLTVALLPRIRAISGENEALADEFEAGVYGLCGMPEKALQAYVKGMGRNPGRIDTYLLIASLMRKTGGEMRAARMFQYLAQTAERDDLFTIAIDGILNLRAQRGTRVPPAVVRWALRTTFERLAAKPSKFYLYRLVTDLAAELGDMPLAIRTLKSALPVAGERRTPVMREILSKAQSMDPAARRVIGGQNPFRPSKAWDATDYIMVGRRLLGQGDHVPPQTYMNLATVFLREDDVAAAVRTFNRAAEALEYSEVLREAAKVLEEADRPKHALQYYRRLLATGADDLGILLTIAKLHEVLQDDERAFDFYRRGMQRVLARKTRYSRHVQEPVKDDPFRFVRGNVSVEDQTMPQFVDGMLATSSAAKRAALLDALEAAIDEDIRSVPTSGRKPEAHALRNYPRLARRSALARSLLIEHGQLERAARLDRRILTAFPEDREAARAALSARSRRGLTKAAGDLLRSSALRDDPEAAQAAGLIDDATPILSAAAAARLLVPKLGKPGELRELLERVDVGRLSQDDRKHLPQLLALCVLLEARDAGERIARAAARNVDLSGRGTFALQRILRMSARLSPPLGRSILREQLQRIAKSTDASSASFFFAYPALDTQLGGGTLDSKAAKALLLDLARNVDRSRPYFYFTMLLGYVEAAERTPFVRELHATLPASHRSRLLLECVNFLGDVEIDEGFASWYSRSLKIALEGSANALAFLPVSNRAVSSQRSDELALRALDVLESTRPSARHVPDRMQALLALGRLDEAYAHLEDRMGAVLSDTQMGPYSFQRCTQMLLRAENTEKTSALYRRLEAAHPDSVKLRSARQRFLTSAAPEVYRSELTSRLEQNPDDVAVLSKLYRLEANSGRPLRALEFVDRLCRLQAKQARWRTERARLEKQLEHPRLWKDAAESAKGTAAKETAAKDPGAKVTAAKVPAAKDTAAKDTAAKDPAAKASKSKAKRAGSRARATRGSAPAIRMVAASRVVAIGSSTTAIRGAPIRILPEARPILELAKAGKLAEARRAFRRYWRNFSPTNRYIRFPSNLRPNSFRQFTDKGLPFLVDEARIVLRVLGDRGAHEIRHELYDILAADLLARRKAKPKSTDAEIQALKDALLAGTAPTHDVEVLLRVLETDDVVEARILEALLTRPDSLDAVRLQKLAKLSVAARAPERAGQLYRMSVLGAQADAFGLMRVNPSAIAREANAIEKLFGEDAKPLLLAWIDDYAVACQDLSQWASAAIPLWVRVLEAPEAAGRIAALLTKMRSGKSQRASAALRMPRADQILATFARAGRFDAALEELEVWIRKDSPPPGPYVRFRLSAEQALRAALDDKGKWQDRSAWLQRLGTRLLELHREGKLARADRLLPAAASSLAQADLKRVAADCAKRALALTPGPSTSAQLVETLRRVDLEADAAQLEEELLRQRVLPVKSIAGALRRIGARDGIPRALALARDAARYTWTRDLLAFLAEHTDGNEAKQWRQRLDAR